MSDECGATDNKSAWAMVVDNLDIAGIMSRSFLRRYWIRGYSIEDLESEATEGIYQAALSFDPRKGRPFRNYAGRAAFNRLMKLLSREICRKAISFEQITQEIRLSDFAPEDEERTGRMARDERLRPEELRRADGRAYTAAECPVNVASVSELGESLAEDMARIPAREAEILRQSYGIGEEPLTSERIGELHGITPRRVNQVLSEARSNLALARKNRATSFAETLGGNNQEGPKESDSGSDTSGKSGREFGG